MAVVVDYDTTATFPDARSITSASGLDFSTLCSIDIAASVSTDVMYAKATLEATQLPSVHIK